MDGAQQLITLVRGTRSSGRRPCSFGKAHSTPTVMGFAYFPPVDSNYSIVAARLAVGVTVKAIIRFEGIKPEYPNRHRDCPGDYGQ